MTVRTAAFPSGLIRGSPTNDTLGVSAILLRSSFRLAVLSLPAGSGRDHKRAVRARAEAAGGEVVRLPGHASGGVVALVREAPADAEHRRGERDKDDGCAHGRHQRTPLHDPAPARRQRPAAGLQRAAEPRDAEAVHPPPRKGEERRQQRHRHRHDDRHREARGDRDSVEEGHAREGEAEERDDDGAARHDHAPAGG